MKITIKHNLIIFHKLKEWHALSEHLRKEYGASIILVSARCKRELGFTVRQHKGLVKWNSDPDYEHDEEWLKAEFKNRYHYEEQIHLDFYNEVQMSWFVLKYLNT